METSENRIIFAQKFPDARPSAILKKIEEQSQTSSTAIKTPPIPFEELLKKFEEKYTYEPKPNVDRESVIFFSLAIEVCRKFEIDTEICKRSHEIVVTMDLYCGWHDGAFKRPFAALLGLADDFTLSYDKSNPEYVRISMSYYTHNRYSNGEKVEW